MLQDDVQPTSFRKPTNPVKVLQFLFLFLVLLAETLPNATGNVTDGAGCGLELSACHDALSWELQAAAELRGNLSQMSAENTALLETVAALRSRVAALEAQSSPARVSAPATLPYSSSPLLAPNAARRLEEPPPDSTGGTQCYWAGSSFAPKCSCMQRPKPLQFDARPEIKVYVASWAAAALDAWLLKFVIEEVLCRGSQKTKALSANCFFLHRCLASPCLCSPVLCHSSHRTSPRSRHSPVGTRIYFPR